MNDSKKILDYLRTHGTGYSKQIARAMGKQLNQISGRFTAMNGLYIERTGEVEEGCDVWRIKQ